MDGEISGTLSPRWVLCVLHPNVPRGFLVVVTDKMAAASDDFNYAAYIY